MIQIVVAEQYGIAICFYHLAGVGVHEVAVCFQMYDAVSRQYLAVHLHEASGGKAFVRFLHLRVREGEPDLGHLSGSKEMGDQFDTGPEEGNVRHTCLKRFFRPCPHTGSLDIDSYKIFVGK